jgi:transposase
VPQRLGDLACPSGSSGAAVLLAQPASKLNVTQRSYLDDFLKVCPAARELRRMVVQFRGMLRWRRAERIILGIETARSAGVPFVASYAKALLRDLRATELAITVPWSNGPIEGHIDRLKTIKRQMNGRAGFELLKARVMPFEPLAA